MPQISSIVYQPLDQDYTGDGFSEPFLRVPTATAVLVANHGIKGDRKAGRNPKRQVNLLSASWLAEKATTGHKTKPGEFGEQLIIDGLAVEELAHGTQLKLGDGALVEIVGPRIGCTRLEATQEKTALAGAEIGVLVKVITGGTIHVGDDVAVIV